MTRTRPQLRGRKWDSLRALKDKVGAETFYVFIDALYAGDIGPYQASMRITRATGLRVDHPRVREIIDRDYPAREDFPI